MLHKFITNKPRAKYKTPPNYIVTKNKNDANGFFLSSPSLRFIYVFILLLVVLSLVPLNLVVTHRQRCCRDFSVLDTLVLSVELHACIFICQDARVCPCVQMSPCLCLEIEAV